MTEFIVDREYVKCSAGKTYKCVYSSPEYVVFKMFLPNNKPHTTFGGYPSDFKDLKEKKHAYRDGIKLNPGTSIHRTGYPKLVYYLRCTDDGNIVINDNGYKVNVLVSEFPDITVTEEQPHITVSEEPASTPKAQHIPTWVEMLPFLMETLLSNERLRDSTIAQLIKMAEQADKAQ